jgi:hypothetical protein
VSYEDDVTAVRRALIRQLREGNDVGAFLVDAVVRAQNQLRDSSPDDLFFYDRLTNNRPGSWEAALLDNMIESGGA